MAEMDPETKAAVDRIVEVIACGDGGGSFIRFLALMETMSQQAARGDRAAQAILEVVQRFARLVKIAQRPLPKEEARK